MEAHVTAQSQSYRLRQRAEEAKLRHGQEVRADIPNVRVGPTAAHTMASGGRFSWLRGEPPRPSSDEGDVFFCNIGPIHVREVVVEGDEEPLPSNVVVEGLAVPAHGNYDIVNAVVRTNGDLRLVIDEHTRLEPVPARVWAPL